MFHDVQSENANKDNCNSLNKELFNNAANKPWHIVTAVTQTNYTFSNVEM